MATEKSDVKSKDESIIETAKKRFAMAVAADADVRKLAREDWKFRAGDQWPDEIKREREQEGRPVLVINRILPSIRQVTNDQRQNRPSIKVHPVDDHGDIETAKIYQGIVRNIEQDSGADVAYDTAFEGAAVGSFGYIRVRTVYVDPTGFDQKIVIDPVEDAFTVYLDPSSKKPDGSDAKWGFIEQITPKDDYIAEHGESELAQSSEWDFGNSDDWIGKDSCRLVEYFYTEYKSVKVVQLSTGVVIDEEKLVEYFAENFPETTQQDIEALVTNRKTAKVPVVKWCKLNGMEILDRTDWLGRWIPIIPVYGDKFVIEGKRVLEGIVRHARDPQRMYNYMKSTEAETIALAPKAPWVIAEGQIPKQYEGAWAQANRRTLSHLVYKPVDHEGHLVPPPQRNTFEAPTQAITQAGLYAADDLKSTTGIYDAAMGNKSNETSGVAIARRNMQAQTSNFHLIDNLTRSIRHVGRICVDLIPKIYDGARAVRMLGEEGEQEIIRINEEFINKGEKVHYKLGVGTYDVSVDTGPSFATKRQEARESMIEMAKVTPQIMQVAPDIIVKNMDWPGAQEIAERLKPPGMGDDKEKKVLPEIQAQMQQMGQMIEQLTQQTNEQASEIKTKRYELDSKERIEYAKLENQLLLKKMEQSADFANAHTERLVNAQLAEMQAAQKGGAIQPEIEPNLPSPDRAPIEQTPQPAGGFSPGAEEQI